MTSLDEKSMEGTSATFIVDMTGEKRIRVQALLDTLERNNINPEGLKTLEELKVLGRVANGADPIYTSKGIELLCKLAFEGDDIPSRREAKRCLANAMFLKPETRTIFVDVGGLDKFVKMFELSATNERVGDDDFLLARIGFLLTAQKGETVERLVNTDRILEHINQILLSYVLLSETGPLSATDSTAFVEMLKFLYNLTFHVKVSEDIAAPLVSQLVKSLISSRIKVFQPPLTNIVHALLNLPLTPSKSILFPESSPTKVVQLIIDTIDRTIPQDTESIADISIDEGLSPVFALLSSLYEIAPPTVKDLMKKHLLPTENDRNLPLGQSQSLASRLLRLVTNAFTPTLREAILSLQFQLTDSSPAAFVDAIGYGYASGFLFSHNIPIPENVQNPQARADINPITGQRLEAENIPDLTEMTDEEKEREAERLFVLFERMRNLGVGVENPVRTAQQSGRFEELD